MSLRIQAAGVPPRRRMPTDIRLMLWVLSCLIPVVAMFAIQHVVHPVSIVSRVGIAALAVLWIIVTAAAVRGELLHHVRTLSNLVESIRTQDYSMKGARAREHGELAGLYHEINDLTDSLKSSRQSEQELLNVLEKVVSRINVAIVVCDSADRIRLVNQLAVTLLKCSAESLVGAAFADTALAKLPLSDQPRLIDFTFPGADGRWQITQQHYRHHGRPSRIVFIADLKQVLSDEEIAAWQRLIRVIGHEVNNSLTPIMSLCQTLTGILGKPDASDHADDVREGMNVIAERAAGLKEFISVYSRLARLPEPQKVLFPVADLVSKMRVIFADKPLAIQPVPDIALFGDPVQIEQALINLIKNALEANPAGAAAIEVSIHCDEGNCELRVVDNGSGISNPENLFVPFYSTKREGAGIGLVLSRQIAAKHHGHVSLSNRQDGPGAVARLILPLPPAV